MHIFVYIVDICSGYGNMGITYKHRSLEMITINETRVSNYDYPKREEYFELVDNTSDLSEGSKDLLKKLFDDQNFEQYNNSPCTFKMSKEEKGHFADLIKKDYVAADEEWNDSAFTHDGQLKPNATPRFTWVTILLNGERMEI